jgi:hypothetical protein
MAYGISLIEQVVNLSRHVMCLDLIILMYCDVRTVVLFRGNKGGYLVTTNGCFLGIHSEKVSSLWSVPRLYISDNGAAGLG